MGSANLGRGMPEGEGDEADADITASEREMITILSAQKIVTQIALHDPKKRQYDTQ